jgi:hypothetical protein
VKRCGAVKRRRRRMKREEEEEEEDEEEKCLMLPLPSRSNARKTAAQSCCENT